MITNLEERRAALIARSDASTDVAEFAKAVADDAAMDERTQAATGIEPRGGALKFVQGEGFKTAEERSGMDYSKLVKTREKADMDLKEKRAVSAPFGVFGELRAVTVGDGQSIVVPRTFSPMINADFNAVSSLIDSVAHLSLNGGESFRQPYITGIDTGNYTGEGADTAEAETHFAYVDILKAKITAYAELTDELFKLPK